MISIEKKLSKLSRNNLHEICKRMKKKHTKNDSKQRLIEILMKPLGKKYKMWSSWFGEENTNYKNPRPKTPPRLRQNSPINFEKLTIRNRPRTPPRRRREKQPIIDDIFVLTNYILRHGDIIDEHFIFFRDEYEISANFLNEIEYGIQSGEYFYNSIKYLENRKIYLQRIANVITEIIDYNDRLWLNYQEQIRIEKEMEEEFRRQTDQARRESERREAEQRRREAEQRRREAKQFFEEQRRREAEQRRREAEQRKREAKYDQSEPMDIDEDENEFQTEERRREAEERRREAEERRREAEQRRREAGRKKTNLCDKYFPKHLTSKKEIKKAYRKLVLKLHPDKGGDEEEFKKMQECYEERK